MILKIMSFDIKTIYYGLQKNIRTVLNFDLNLKKVMKKMKLKKKEITLNHFVRLFISFTFYTSIMKI